MKELKLQTIIETTMEASTGEIVSFLGNRKNLKKEISKRIKEECFMELAQYQLEGFKYETKYHLEEEQTDFDGVERFTGVLEVTLCVPRGGKR